MRLINSLVLGFAAVALASETHAGAGNEVELRDQARFVNVNVNGEITCGGNVYSQNIPLPSMIVKRSVPTGGIMSQISDGQPEAPLTPSLQSVTSSTVYPSYTVASYVPLSSVESSYMLSTYVQTSYVESISASVWLSYNQLTTSVPRSSIGSSASMPTPSMSYTSYAETTTSECSCLSASASTIILYTTHYGPSSPASTVVSSSPISSMETISVSHSSMASLASSMQFHGSTVSATTAMPKISASVVTMMSSTVVSVPVKPGSVVATVPAFESNTSTIPPFQIQSPSVTGMSSFPTTTTATTTVTSVKPSESTAGSSSVSGGASHSSSATARGLVGLALFGVSFML